MMSHTSNSLYLFNKMAANVLTTGAIASEPYCTYRYKNAQPRQVVRLSRQQALRKFQNKG